MPWVKLEVPTKEEEQAIADRHRGRAKFLVDESIGETVAEILKHWGYNTKYAAEEGLLGRSDEDVFAAAWKLNRVIVTHDPDFLDDRKFPPHRNPGVIVIHPGASGKDNAGMLTSMARATNIAAWDSGEWYRGRKLEFTSQDQLTITSQRGYAKYMYRGREVYEWVPDE
jgi:predicted nuclease of predicted toxin-antitoxin system